MSTFILVVIITVIILLLLQLFERREKPASNQPGEANTPTFMKQDFGEKPENMKIGDTFAWGGRGRKVIGLVTHAEGGYKWWEFMLESGDWLSVEIDDGDRGVFLWETVPNELALVPKIGKSMEHDGVTYMFIENGTSTYVSEGDVNVGQSGQCQYVDFRTPDGLFGLSFERYGDSGAWEVSIGSKCPEATYDIRPA